jgi:hypothetical protein
MRNRLIPIGLLAVLLLGGGITAALVLNHRAGEEKKQRPQQGPPLLVERNLPPITAESGPDSYRDFQFQSQRDHPVSIGVELKDCQCASIYIWLAPDEWKGLDSKEMKARAGSADQKWTLLEQNTGFSTPAGSVGLLRLGWKGNKLGDERFWASLWVDDAGERGFQRIETTVHFIEPIVVRPENNLKLKEVDLGTLGAGEQRSVNFLCYSGTRKQFTLTEIGKDKSPFIDLGKPQALKDDELRTLAEKTGKTVLSAFRVIVIVHENVGDRRLDLGPFRLPVAWQTDVAPGHLTSTVVTGSVAGEVELVSDKGKPFVDLGAFSPTRSSPNVFVLESSDPNIDLAVDEERSLEFLKAELVDAQVADGKKRWQVRVQYRPDALFRGTFPSADRPGYDSDVACSLAFRILRPDADKENSRRLLVPVHGVVTAR